MISPGWLDYLGESDYFIGFPLAAGSAWLLMTWRMSAAAPWPAVAP